MTQQPARDDSLGGLSGFSYSQEIENLWFFQKAPRDPPSVRALRAEVARARQAAGDQPTAGLAWTLLGLSKALARDGKGVEATPLYVEAITAFERLSEPWAPGVASKLREEQPEFERYALADLNTDLVVPLKKLPASAPVGKHEHDSQ